MLKKIRKTWKKKEMYFLALRNAPLLFSFMFSYFINRIQKGKDLYFKSHTYLHFLLHSTLEEINGIVKNFDFRFLTDLYDFGCPEHKFIAFTKCPPVCLSVCDINFC